MRQADVIVIEGAKSFYRERDGGDCFRMRRGEKNLRCEGGGGHWQRKKISQNNVPNVKACYMVSEIYVQEKYIGYYSS